MTIMSARKSATIALALMLGCAVLAIRQPPFFTGTDLASWLPDANRLADCINTGKTPCASLSFFPLGYLANSGILNFLFGTTNSHTASVTIVNTVLLFLPLLLFANLCRSLRDFLAITSTYFACVLISPLSSFYVYSGALETQAGPLLGIAFSGYLYGEKAKSRTANISMCSFALFAWLLYKDTNIAIAIVFFGSLAAIRAYTNRDSGYKIRQFRTELLIASSTILAALASNLGYNYYKYGSILPIAYLEIAAASRPSAGKSLEFFLHSLFSLNGGVFIFWSLPIFLALYLPRASIDRSALKAAGIGLALTLLALSGFALWWSPFGWDSFGNRLVIPFGFATLVMILGNACCSERRKTNERAPLLARVVLIMIAAISSFYCLVTLASDKGKLWEQSLFGGPHCKRMWQAISSGQSASDGGGFWQSATYYNCAEERFNHVPAISEY